MVPTGARKNWHDFGLRGLEFLVIVRLGLFIYRNMTSLKTWSTSEFQVKLTCNRLFRALPKVCLHVLHQHYAYETCLKV